MSIKKIMNLPKKTQTAHVYLFVLFTLVILLSFISSSYKLAGMETSGTRDIEDSITPKKMKRLESKIRHLQKRVDKKPDDIIAREEIIRLRTRYLKKFDDCFDALAELPQDKITAKQRCETKIKLIQKKKACALKIIDDYSQLTDGQVKYFDDLRMRAFRGSTGFEINLRFSKSYDIERVIYEMVKNDSTYNMVRITREIDREKERVLKMNKDSIERYQSEDMKLETQLQRSKDDCEGGTE